MALPNRGKIGRARNNVLAPTSTFTTVRRSGPALRFVDPANRVLQGLGFVGCVKAKIREGLRGGGRSVPGRAANAGRSRLRNGKDQSAGWLCRNR